MAEFFHAGRTNTDDCYDAGKHMHGSRRVYGHDDASVRRRLLQRRRAGRPRRRRRLRLRLRTEGAEGGQAAQQGARQPLLSPLEIVDPMNYSWPACIVFLLAAEAVSL
ncbi:uncharacterized protein LOC110433992 [Sorghum bicolor]|uniref:uncharacterized protein LOC110433992 n=1 Tax=Sorghum bicolor TaxID=4558 RepID=UPI00081AD425|nr:uncharacterized protein LOC110433992 [Sorghum bicolor]|eukprot:XP_021313047.1 uncharacterized protein LOC110433992 [Sorghum bicolor]